MIKIQQNTKTGKSEKCKKWQKHKNQKIKKVKKWQNEKVKNAKKHQKLTPPWKWPKCHLNDQNRHFVKSEPPGPAFFRFQGVPRDPVLRPKLDPPFFWHFLIIFQHFHVLWIVNFVIFRVLIKWWFAHF